MNFPWFLVAVFAVIILGPVILQMVLPVQSFQTDASKLGIKPTSHTTPTVGNQRIYRDPLQLTISWWGPDYIATVDQYGHEEPAKMPLKVQLWQQVEFLHKQGNPEYNIPQNSTGLYLRYVGKRISPYGDLEVYEVQFGDASFSVYAQCNQLGSQEIKFDSH